MIEQQPAAVNRYSEYDNWAWLYNITAGPDYGEKQLKLLDRVLFPSLQAGDRILDLCCGTGQLLQPLLDRGYGVTGLDGSEQMLSHARQNAPQAQLLLADARDFSVEQPFSGAICTSASLNHIPSLDDLQQVFLCLANALQDGAPLVFDINHREQMHRYWRGQPGEGEIRDDYAWLITPFFDEQTLNGAFHVDIYRREQTPASSWKKMLGRLLSHRRLTRMRLRLLKRFATFQPQWHHSELRYAVHGHALEEVKALLQDCGFEDIAIETLEGSQEITADHSAHFICRKALSAVNTEAMSSIPTTVVEPEVQANA